MKNEIYPCLWFDGNAKEAAEFYCSVFDDTRITSESALIVTFVSAGQKFMCLNGGPEFRFNPSKSFYVVCETEEEVEKLWKRFFDGGTVLMALDRYNWSRKYGWIQDQFGISWQLSFGGHEDTGGQKISPVLMFTDEQSGKAEEAVHFYTTVFENSSIQAIIRYEAGEGDVEGRVKHARFVLNQNVFMAMDSSLSHQFGFNESISFVVECDTQGEIDYYWDRLTRGGEESMCGWLKDRYGVSWQIIPSVLENLMSDPDRSKRVTDAFMQMKKFDIKKLLTAADVKATV